MILPEQEALTMERPFKSITVTDSKPAVAIANLLEGKYYVAVSSKNAKNISYRRRAKLV